ncbi:MAG: terminase large subunit domain-containing protein [Thiohalospira sp.]
MSEAAPGAILLGYQQRWVQDKSPVKVIEKSRRIGLSYAEAADAVLHAAAAEGANVYYISYDKEMTSGFIQDCASWARAFNAAAGEIQESVIEREDRQILTYTIKFDSGHQIQTFSSNPRNLRSKGRPGERLIVDEAAFVDDIEALLKAAMAMTMWGGSVRIISTHNGEENPFNGLVNDIRSGRKPYSLHRVTLDDALGDGLFRRICEVTGREWSPEAEAAWRQEMVERYRPNEDEELFCVPSRGGGAYFSRALVEARMTPAQVLRFHGDDAFNAAPEPARAAQVADWIRDELVPALAGMDRQRRHALGMDFARRGHLSVLAPMRVGEALEREVPLLVELRNVPHRQQQQVLFALGDRLPRLGGVVVDATGPGSYIAEAAADHWGSLVEQLQLSERWYRENMPRHKARFEDGTITVPKHDDLLEDYRAWRLVRGVPRLPDSTTDQARQRHGDAAMAIALADYASEIETPPVDYASAGPREALRAPGADRPAPLQDTGWGTVGGGPDLGAF